MKVRDPAVQEPEMIWEGRLHLGDEPGVYGDASYAGLAIELPVTLTKYEKPEVADDITFELTANEISIVGKYPGHLVTAFGFEAIPAADPKDPVRWRKAEVGQSRFTTAHLAVTTHNTAGKQYFSVRIEIDTTVPPGLYDDFVLLALNLRSKTHYADFGFRYI